MSQILIIEDEDSIRRVLKKVLLDDNPGYDFLEASDGEQGVKMIAKHDVDLVLCDIKMPKKDGIEVLQFITVKKPYIPVVMISGHGDLATAVQAMRMGAFDYIAKPPDLNHLLTTVRSAMAPKKQHPTTRKTQKKSTNSMIGQDASIEQIRTMIEKVAPTHARVLIQGPNGSGKELVAHALHQQSGRASGPMVEVNCAAIPSELIESELFGHIKGAFTSAHKDRAGKFESANGGTLFLDEVGDMSLSAQAKVLRALQEHKVQRVGSDKDIPVDVRVVAATNKNLQEEIAAKRFREDLFHRLAVIEIFVPPLNNRRSDIPMLIAHFNKDLKPKKEFQPEAIDKLQQMDWPGNVRQLRNVVDRLHILSETVITANEVEHFAQINPITS
jgi:two-component system nitrogen regulation response regulator NtrX